MTIIAVKDKGSFVKLIEPRRVCQLKNPNQVEILNLRSFCNLLKIESYHQICRVGSADHLLIRSKILNGSCHRTTRSRSYFYTVNRRNQVASESGCNEIAVNRVLTKSLGQSENHRDIKTDDKCTQILLEI